MSGVGTAMKDLLLANVASALAGVSINIFGITLTPFAFLQSWANDLVNQANTAVANAAAAQTSADNAQTSANNAQTSANNAQATADSKPSITQIPIGSDLWKSINSDEDSTFPRANLNFGSSDYTSSTDGTSGTHSHDLDQTPDYQPAGNGSDFLEIAYIRASRTRTYDTMGFITGGSATWAGISGAYVGIYSVDSATGNLTLLNTVSASTDISSAITTANTEQRLSLGQTISATQGEIFAVGVLQVTSALQTCASLMKTTLTDIDPPSVQYPRKNYCYSGGYTAVPTSITESNLNYSASDKLPFYVLR